MTTRDGPLDRVNTLNDKVTREAHVILSLFIRSSLFKSSK